MNKSTSEVTWIDGAYTYRELIRQEYELNHCVFSAGEVEGAGMDTLYLKWKKDGDAGVLLLLTPDELQALVWVAAGAVWSHLFNQRKESE